MIFHNSAQPYTRPAVTVGVRQQLARRHALDLPGGLLIWKQIGRMAFAVLSATIALHLMLGVYGNHMTEKSSVFEAERHQLMDRNIVLRATRAGMLTRQSVEAAAGKALSLYTPTGEQQFVFNREKGRFDNL